MVKKTPAYKNKLRALELERSGGTTNRKKSNKQTSKYELISKAFCLSYKIPWMSFSCIDNRPSMWTLYPFKLSHFWLIPIIGLSIL